MSVGASGALPLWNRGGKFSSLPSPKIQTRDSVRREVILCGKTEDVNPELGESEFFVRDESNSYWNSITLLNKKKKD